MIKTLIKIRRTVYEEIIAIYSPTKITIVSKIFFRDTEESLHAPITEHVSPTRF